MRGGGIATGRNQQFIIGHKVVEQQAHKAGSRGNVAYFVGRAFENERVQTRRMRRQRCFKSRAVAPADAARFKNRSQQLADLRVARGHIVFARPERERATRRIERLRRNLRNHAVNDGALGVACGVGRANKRAEWRSAVQVAALRRPTSG